MTSSTATATATAAAMNDLPVFYVKSGCRSCDEGIAFLDEHGIPYHHADIARDASAAEALQKLSGQGRVPTLDWHGHVLIDFGLEELVPFLRARNVRLEDN